MSSASIWSAIDKLTAIAGDLDRTSPSGTSLQTCCMSARDAVIAYTDLDPDCSVSALLAALSQLVDAAYRLGHCLRHHAPESASIETLIRDASRRTHAIEQALAKIENPASRASTTSRTRWAHHAFEIVANFEHLKPQLMNVRGGELMQPSLVTPRETNPVATGSLAPTPAEPPSEAAMSAKLGSPLKADRESSDRSKPTSLAEPTFSNDAKRGLLDAESFKPDDVSAKASLPESGLGTTTEEGIVSALRPRLETDNPPNAQQVLSDDISLTARSVGRVLFEAPPGSGHTREFEGSLFTFDPSTDIWSDEGEAERRLRVQTIIEKCVGADTRPPKQPWQVYLPITASLEASREIATAVMGSYQMVTGTSLEVSTFDIVPAEPLLALRLDSLLRAAISPLWRTSRWKAKVLGEAGISDGGTNLWAEIDPAHRVYRSECAAWIDVHNEPLAGGTPHHEIDNGVLNVTFGSGTDDPVPRFAQAANSFLIKPMPVRSKGGNNFSTHVQPAGISDTRCVLLLGPAGTGKSFTAAQYKEWMTEIYYPNLRVFTYNAANHRTTKNEYVSLIDNIDYQEASGRTCLLMCDEVQHLTADDVERLAVSSLLFLSGDIRQAGAGSHVHPVIAFARQIRASVLTMNLAWRASNIGSFNAMSYVFYDGAFSALGEGHGHLDPPLFRYEICSDDCESIAARCWAAAKYFRDNTEGNLMIAVERDDVRQSILEIAGCDQRTWVKRPTCVTLTKPSLYQGREADVVLVLADEIVSASDKIEASLRGLVTLLGRARKEIWFIFTKMPDLRTPACRAAASVLRSILENRVNIELPARAIELDTRVEEEVKDYDFELHDFAKDTIALCYRSQKIGFVTTPHSRRVSLTSLLIEKGWFVIDFADHLAKKPSYYYRSKLIPNRDEFKSLLSVQMAKIDKMSADSI